MAPRHKTWRDEEEDEEEAATRRRAEAKAWAKDLGIAAAVLVIVLVAIFVYTGVWPPLVVVESSSMQHGDTVSHIGVIDTGDLVFVQAAPQRSDVITYLQGRASGYTTYGDYGDVIIFRLYYEPGATPIIHRAIMWVRPNGTGTGDVPDLALLPSSQWEGTIASGQPTHSPYDLRSVWIQGMGYDHNLNITFMFANVAGFSRGPGYITMGDNNAYQACVPGVPCTGGWDRTWFPIQSDIIGHARGEIPWFGLIKLVLAPAQGSGACCPLGWNDPAAPANSWTDLDLALLFLIALPFILEGIFWAWGKYARPRVRRFLHRAAPAEETEPPEPKAPPEEPWDDEEDDL